MHLVTGGQGPDGRVDVDCVSDDGVAGGGLTGRSDISLAG